MNASAFLNEKEVAKILGLSVATLRKWRLQGHGPTYRKFGTAVRYSVDAVEDWIRRQPRGGGSEMEGRAA